MAQQQQQQQPQQQALPSQVDSAQPQSLPPPPPPPPFDPSRMIGIIKRKALIKELAAVYHAECLQYCQELLELQRKWDEVFDQIGSSGGIDLAQERPLLDSYI
ncbi:hypothetical protein TIFTF001_012389 [Ficus carica]|uniref:Uncharacterized protein n=1 Tax=Ficus carica TaxID=3494 RepID=A0AA87ZVV8_FICCA|nr:hypothetical protein TIFTF001_012389 [Ficus carica]